MRREGSALHGFGVVTLKEIADHFTSILVVVLVVLVVATAVAVVRGAIDQIKEITAEDPFLFLRLFTRGGPLPLVALLSFLVPLVAIGLGFDAVNGEHNRRTLSRILSQPIYRDALLFGKFVAGLFTLSISLIVLWLLVIGFGLLGLGVPPNAEEMARALVLLVVTIAYAGFWFALALLFSVVFRSAATAALVSLGVWLFLTILWPLFSPALADAVTTAGDVLGVLDTRQTFARLSPERIVQRDRCGRARSLGALDPAIDARRDGTGLDRARRHPGCADTARAKRADRVAADRRPGGRHDPALRHRLHRVPAAGSAGLSFAGSNRPDAGRACSAKKRKGTRAEPSSCSVTRRPECRRVPPAQRGDGLDFEPPVLPLGLRSTAWPLPPAELILLPYAAGVAGLHAARSHGGGGVGLRADWCAARIALDRLVVAAGLLVHLLRWRLLRARD